MRVIIIGAGGIGRRHIRGFLKTGRARISVCEPDVAKLREVSRDFPIEDAYTDIEEVPLEKFDMGVVSAPAHVHVPIARRLADAGVCFLVEKPLALSMEGLDGLINTVEAKGLVARVGYVRRVRPWVVALREDIRKGRIGRPLMALINMSQDYRRYRPDYRDIYYARRTTGGGAIMDCATHAVDLLLWMLGPVTEVSTLYDRLVMKGVECEDAVLMSLRFASGAMAQVAINQFQKPNMSTIEVVGTAGNLRLDDIKGKLEFANDDSGAWEATEFLTGGESFMEVHESMFALQAEMFMDAMSGKPDLLATLDEGRRNVAVCLAAVESYVRKKILPLPSDLQVCTDDRSESSFTAGM